MNGQDPPSDDAARETEQFDAAVAGVELVRVSLFFVAIVIWAILGFLFWIPMMCYAMVRFSTLVVYTTIVNADPISLGIHMDHSVRFYFQGFKNILRAMYHKPEPHTSDTATVAIELRVIVAHLVGTLLFWTAIIAPFVWWRYSR